MGAEDTVFLGAMIATAKAMFEEDSDRYDLHYTELADRYWGGLAHSSESYGAVRARLKQIRDALDIDGVFTILMSRDYFGILEKHEQMRLRVMRPNERPPLDDLRKMSAEDLRPLLAGGNSKAAHGLYRPLDKDDPIEAVQYEYTGRSTNGKLRKTAVRLAAAYTAGRVSDDTRREVLRKAIPEDVLDTVGQRKIPPPPPTRRQIAADKD